MGFEPTVGCPTHAFQACAFDRSAISPDAVCRAHRFVASPGRPIGACSGARFWGDSALRRSGRAGRDSSGENDRAEPTATRCRATAATELRRVFVSAGRLDRAARPSTRDAFQSGVRLGVPAGGVSSSAPRTRPPAEARMPIGRGSVSILVCPYSCISPLPNRASPARGVSA